MLPSPSMKFNQECRLTMLRKLFRNVPKQGSVTERNYNKFPVSTTLNSFDSMNNSKKKVSRADQQMMHASINETHNIAEQIYLKYSKKPPQSRILPLPRPEKKQEVFKATPKFLFKSTSPEAFRRPMTFKEDWKLQKKLGNVFLSQNSIKQNQGLPSTKLFQPLSTIYTPSRYTCLLYTSPSPRDLSTSRMPSSA
eukprot:TRINITY_DN22170_c0_g1_i1.p1 TRINITY_DN22170_c0_g1~~TRINITY_DN22170_c0_g1_i1.p1  ORF type:complete len:195 (-),score=27.70 TRINITY_DN22170_c0_g1_i1:71-655(-)